jgi:hypothetical protein
MSEEMETSTAGRRDRLTAAAARLRARGSVPGDRAFQIAGWVLVPLGILLILLAWYGAANTTRVWQQIPYMVSGGLLGLGLIFAGGFGYFAAWLTRLVDESRRQSAEAAETAQRSVAVLERIETLLREGAGLSTAPVLVVADKGTLVHRADCAMVAGRTDLRRPGPRERGLRPCKVCRPDVSSVASTGPSRRRPAR